MTEKRRGRPPGPRIRTIKPEWWQEEAVGDVSRDARLCLLVLRTMADDEGRLRALPSLIIGHGFPYEDDVTPRVLRRWLDALEEHGHIVRYEHEGKPYVVILRWREEQLIQRPTPSRLPAPPDPAIVTANAPSPSEIDPGTFTESSAINHGQFQEPSLNTLSPPRGGAPAAAPADADRGPGPSSATTPEEQERGARATPAGVVDQHSLPDGFPERLAARAEHVLAALTVLQQRVSPRSAPPTLYRVALALREYPDVDHEALIHKLDLWAMDPKRLQRRNRHDLDIPGVYMTFCETAQRGAAGRSPADGGPAVVQSARDVLAARESMREQRRAAVGG